MEDKKNEALRREKMVKLAANVDKMLIRKWKKDISDICYKKLTTVISDSDHDYQKCLTKLSILYKNVLDYKLKID